MGKNRLEGGPVTDEYVELHSGDRRLPMKVLAKALAAVLLALLSGCATTDDAQGLAAFLGGMSEGMSRSRTCLVTPIGRGGVYSADCD
jgi:hypothetical protein